MSSSPRLVGWTRDNKKDGQNSSGHEPGKKPPPEEGGDNHKNDHVGDPKYSEIENKRIGTKKERLMSIATENVAQHLLRRRRRRRRGGDFDERAHHHDESVEKSSDTAGGGGGGTPPPIDGEILESSFPEDNKIKVESLRGTDFYKSALRSIRWQRDNYLVGRDYANQRRDERQKEEEDETTVTVGIMDPVEGSTPQPPPPPPPKPINDVVFNRPIPYDPSALGNQQLTRLGSWFIPSSVVHNQALKLVLGLPTGPLADPILNSTVNLIPVAQRPLDRTIKTSLIRFLENDDWKDFIKRSTNGYIAQTYRDSPRQPSS